MDQAVGQHEHYRSRTTGKDRKMAQDVFVLKHYAGDVSVPLCLSVPTLLIALQAWPMTHSIC